VSEEAKHWIASTLTDATKRMTVEQARAHPWLAEAVEGERRRAERRERIRTLHQQHQQQQGPGQGQGQGQGLGGVGAASLVEREKDGEREREQGRGSLSSAAGLTDHSTHSTSSAGTVASNTALGSGAEGRGRERANTTSTAFSVEDAARSDRPRCAIS